MGKIILIGFILLIIAIILIFIGSIKTTKIKSETAFGGFIFGLPFGFASSKRMFYILLVFLAVLFTINIILRYLR